MNNLEKYTYEWLLQDALSRVPNTVDKRQGSIIYDALAPACYELSLYFMELNNMLVQTFVNTASGEYLDRRVAEQGIEREVETHAIKLGIFTDINDAPMAVNIGSRFSNKGDDLQLNYEVVEVHTDSNGLTVPGAYRLRCEMPGVRGNNYYGELIPISYIRNLKTAMLTDTIIPAQDNESDESLRERYVQKVNNRPFGGNVAQYDQEVRAIDGVGELQIYPTWDGGGTVKLSVIDSGFEPISGAFINELEQLIDPENVTGDKGDGLGIAPIGHNVTIVTPTVKEVAIVATLRLDAAIVITQVEQAIKDNIEAYFLDLRAQWGIGNELNQYQLGVYVAKVINAILSVSGVVNVTNVTLDGSTNDIELTQNATLQQLPKVGSVVLNVE